MRYHRVLFIGGPWDGYLEYLVFPLRPDIEVLVPPPISFTDTFDPTFTVERHRYKLRNYADCFGDWFQYESAEERTPVPTGRHAGAMPGDLAPGGFI